MLTAAAFALTLAAAPVPMPPIVVHVSAASNISPALVRLILDETDAVWHDTGVTFTWEDTRVSATTPYGPQALRVLIGNESGPIRNPDRRPLGWIRFDEATPDQEIYLSYANAYSLLADSSAVVGHLVMMPVLQRNTLLGRAMGRALAHEIGHYVSGSKAHTKQGLMAAVHSAYELFAPPRSRFGIAQAERLRMVARLTSIYMASRG